MRSGGFRSPRVFGVFGLICTGLREKGETASQPRRFRRFCNTVRTTGKQFFLEQNPRRAPNKVSTSAIRSTSVPIPQPVTIGGRRCRKAFVVKLNSKWITLPRSRPHRARGRNGLRGVVTKQHTRYERLAKLSSTHFHRGQQSSYLFELILPV